MRLVRACDRLINLSFSLLFFLVPLILLPFTSEIFEFNKMTFTYLLTIIISACWLTKMVLEKRFIFKKTPLAFPFLLFWASQFLSFLFSIDRHLSLFGYYSRFHGGLLSITCFILLYFALISNLGREDVFRFLKTSLLSTFIIAFYGALEHFGIDKDIWVQDVENRVFSTLGQPNWLAAYLVTILPLTMTLILKENRPTPRVLYYFLFVLFYLCLIFTKSRSGFIGLFFVLAAFWGGLFLFNGRFFRERRRVFVNLISLIIIFSIIAGTPWTPKLQYLISPPKTEAPVAPSSGTVLESGGTASTQIRKIVYQGAIDIWKNNLLLGTGPETFALSYYKYRPPAHNLVSEWDFLYNKAHNEYLNYAANTGTIGLAAYLFLIFSCLWFFKRSLLQEKKPPLENFLFTLALLASYVSILVTNFSGFSVVVISIYFYLIPAIAFLLNRQADTQVLEVKSLPPLSLKQIMGVLTVILTAFFLFLTMAKIWRADTFYTQAYHLTRLGQYSEAYPLFHQAIDLYPSETLYRDNLALSDALLASAAWEQKEATLAAQLGSEAIYQNGATILASPLNVSFWKTRGKIFYLLSDINQEYTTEAINSLKSAQELAPTDPRINYDLAVLYGRLDQNQEAINSLEKAIQLKPNYREARLALALFYEQTGKRQEATSQLKYILEKIASDDAGAIKKLKQWGEN
jgi:O-antigen ligase/Flp pilus assembly protein TadD